MAERRELLIVLGLVAALVLAVLLRSLMHTANTPEITIEDGERPARIISMAPSITEVLFAVGAGDQVAGVTRYCDYPPEAARRPQVGGYLDPSYEAVLALQPDLIVILSEQESSAGRMFRELGLEVLTVEQRDLSGIMESITAIGEAVGRQEEALRLRDSLETRMDELRSRLAGRPRPSTLVVLGRNLAQGDLANTYIAGNDGFYNDLVDLAGGSNCYLGRTIAFPAVSAEGLLGLAPEVIIEVIPNLGRIGVSSERFERSWRDIPGLEAVEKGNVHVFVTDYAVRPGPRFMMLAMDMARAIHPEIDWKQ